MDFFTDSLLNNVHGGVEEDDRRFLDSFFEYYGDCNFDENGLFSGFEYSDDEVDAADYDMSANDEIFGLTVSTSLVPEEDARCNDDCANTQNEEKDLGNSSLGDGDKCCDGERDDNDVSVVYDAGMDKVDDNGGEHCSTDRVDSDTVCSICLQTCSESESCDDDGGDDMQVYELHCGHAYHMQCISSWFRVDDRCPLCKSSAQITCDNDRRALLESLSANDALQRLFARHSHPLGIMENCYKVAPVSAAFAKRHRAWPHITKAGEDDGRLLQCLLCEEQRDQQMGARDKRRKEAQTLIPGSSLRAHYHDHHAYGHCRHCMQRMPLGVLYRHERNTCKLIPRECPACHDAEIPQGCLMQLSLANPSRMSVKIDNKIYAGSGNYLLEHHGCKAVAVCDFCDAAFHNQRHLQDHKLHFRHHTTNAHCIETGEHGDHGKHNVSAGRSTPKRNSSILARVVNNIVNEELQFNDSKSNRKRRRTRGHTVVNTVKKIKA